MEDVEELFDYLDTFVEEIEPIINDFDLSDSDKFRLVEEKLEEFKEEIRDGM